MSYWRGVDDEPTAGSQNLVKSGGVYLSETLMPLVGIDSTWYYIKETGWNVGDRMYNDVEGVIKTVKEISSVGGVVQWYETTETPSKNKIYKIKDELYVWDGISMRNISSLWDRSASFIGEINNKFIGDKIVEISSETGYINLGGDVVVGGLWTTRKYNVENHLVVYATGRSTANSYLAATYDENDNLLNKFVGRLNGSTDFYNVLINVSGAKYLKVSGLTSSETSPKSSCNKIVSETFNDKVNANDLPSLVKNIEIEKTIDIEQGSLNSLGPIPSPARIRSTNFISSSGTLLLNSTQGYGYRVYEYSSDSFNDFIQYNLYDEGGLNTFVPQSNTTYIRFVFLKSSGDNVSVSEFDKWDFTINGEKQTAEDWSIASVQYVDAKVSKKILQEKTVVFLGDSITQGGQGTGEEKVTPEKVYHKIFANLTGCINVNLGIGGTCIADHTLNDLGPSRFVTRATQQNLQNADYIVVWGGTNDFSYDSKAIGPVFNEETITPVQYIGSKKKVATTDTDTFDGALHDLILTIRSHNATAPIMFMTPLNRGRYSTGRPTSEETNQWDNWLDDFRDTIKKVCNFYSIPVFDIGRYSCLDPLNGAINTKYFVDLLHPNASGHEVIGTLLYHWFKANMVY